MIGDSQNASSYNASKDDLIWSTKYAPIISLGITVKL